MKVNFRRLSSIDFSLVLIPENKKDKKLIKNAKDNLVSYFKAHKLLGDNRSLTLGVSVKE